MRKFLPVIAALGIGLGTLVIGGGGSAGATGPCWSNPTSCGYPDASNTGNTHAGNGTYTGTYYTGNGGACNQATVIQNLDITGSMVINGSNLLIKNVRIFASGGPAIVVEKLSTSSCIQLQDVDIVGDGAAGQVCLQTAGGGGTDRFQRLDVSGCEVGIQNASTTSLWVNDSFIHGLSSSAGTPHYAGIKFNDVVGIWPSEHNTIWAQTTGYGVDWAYPTAHNPQPFVDKWLIVGGVYNMRFTGDGAVYQPGTVTLVQNRLEAGSSGYITRNMDVSTTQSGYTANIDDTTEANINSSM